MAKVANELDLASVKSKLSSNKKVWDQIFLRFTPDQQKIAKKLLDTTSVNCHIFAGSLAFRVGKSSVKSIAGYPSGFKASFPTTKTAKDMFLTAKYEAKSFSFTKDSFVLAMAFYFLYKSFDRVKTESDKTEQAETEQVASTQSALDKLIKQRNGCHLKVGNSIYQVDAFSQIGGRPKADAYFSYKGKPVVWVSLKKGAFPGNFQQYGGIQDLGIKGTDFNQYPDIVEFAKKVTKIFKTFGLKPDGQGRYDFNNFKKGSNFGGILTDPHTACKVIFGKDFGGTFGENNVNVTIDGDIVFKPVKGKTNVYELDGTFHASVNPKELGKTATSMKFSPNDIYSPVMLLVKSEAQGLNNLGFSNVRFYIWPNNTIASGYATNLNNIVKTIDGGNKILIKQLKQSMVK